MKDFMEEYGGVLIAVMVVLILVAFLYLGFREDGWLRTLVISYAKRTYGG